MTAKSAAVFRAGRRDDAGRLTRARRDDIVVTGLGASTPLGGDVASTWAGLLDGRSGASAIGAGWARDLPARIAARVAVEPDTALERVAARRLDRCQQLAVVAGRQAWTDARLPRVGEGGIEAERLAVVIGSGIGGVLTLLGQHDVLIERGSRWVSPHMVPMLLPNGPAAAVALDLGARAAVHTPVSACASGAEALALGLDLLRSGRADVVLAGGVDAAIHPVTLAGFAQMRALSTRNDEPAAASRPFDKSRDGFVMGEGAGVLALEWASAAAVRGATPYAVFAGAGVTADGHHITAPDPNGTGAARAITLALRDGDLSPQDVRHVNAHATSTPAGDVAEAKAIRSAIGDHPVLTAPKSALGHLLGGAGAVEAIATVLTVRDDVVPPTRNLDDPDDAVGLDVVRMSPRRMAVLAAVNNAFGFGGHNVALAFHKL